MKLVHLVGDYGPSDPAFSEIINKFASLDSELRVNPVNVPKFSTLATGFWISQLALVNPFSELSVFSNTAPRVNMAKDESLTYKGKYGHLAFAKLANGVPIFAVHVGHTFSFIKPYIREFRLANVSNVGSQFRSRDFYPDAVVKYLHGDSSVVGEEIPLDSIPDIPLDRIGFIDGYGNIKTTRRVSNSGDFKEGMPVSVTLNGQTHKGVIGGETYHVHDGELCVAPGSSGGQDKFFEIWVKGGSAADRFGFPHVESEFILKAL